MTVELPRPQVCFEGQTAEMADSVSFHLNKVLKEHIKPENVHSVLELGCGNGAITAGSLSTFPNADIYAVDYYDVLDRYLLQNPRIKFTRGLFTDVLQQRNFEPVDIIMLIFLGRHHGFNEENIHLLGESVKSGGLIFTEGDNGMIENLSKFQQYFQLTKWIDIDLCIWRKHSI
jgi:16S rRNA G1207 methylase RsmC